MRDDPRSDGELVARLAAGDHDVCAELVRRHLRAATLLAVQLTGDRDDAEDVVQAAFILAIDRAEHLDPSRPFAPWLYGVVRRLALKRRVRHARRLRLWQRWRAHDATAVARDETRLDAASELALVRRELQTLPAMQQVCFELVVLRDLCVEDVAAMYEISPSTVRQHVFRARRELRARREAPPGVAVAERLDGSGER